MLGDPRSSEVSPSANADGRWALAPDGRWVAAAPPAGAGHPEGTLAIYDRSGDVTHVLRGHKNWVMTLSSIDGGRSLASAGDTVRVWDFTGDEPTPVFASERSPVTGRLASDARGRLWSGHRDGTVVGWDVATGRRTGPFAAFGDEITGLVVLGERLPLFVVVVGFPSFSSQPASSPAGLNTTRWNGRS